MYIALKKLFNDLYSIAFFFAEDGTSATFFWHWRLAIDDWRLTIGDWRLTIGDWRLTIGDWILPFASNCY